MANDQGLTLETSALQIFHGGNSTFINSPTAAAVCLGTKNLYLACERSAGA